jgi:hypothetical protein
VQGQEFSLREPDGMRKTVAQIEAEQLAQAKKRAADLKAYKRPKLIPAIEARKRLLAEGAKLGKASRDAAKCKALQALNARRS